MDQSCSENDLSMSPSQLLERLQALRQLQLMQRGKLQKQRLHYHESSETSSYLTEIISHFSNSCNSTSYNTFRSLLQSPQLTTPNDSPRLDTSDISAKTSEISPKIRPKDMIEGISVLNLSKESEFIVASPLSSRSTNSNTVQNRVMSQSVSAPKNLVEKKQIALDEMPILSPRKDFEELVIEKLQNEKHVDKFQNQIQNVSKIHTNDKKPFLKRGEGMARFGLKKTDLVIQKTKSLPWRKKKGSQNTTPIKSSKPVQTNGNNDKLNVKILDNEPKLKLSRKTETKPIINSAETVTIQAEIHENNHTKESEEETSKYQFKIPEIKIQRPKGKHPLIVNKGKTWAAVLTKEQSDFLSQLKQSDYYKNFASPTKSTVSDISCDDNFAKLRQERELAEQNLFELLENKVTNESFNLENSFFNRFLKQSNLECSGESTPLIMQKCLASNPELRHILPEHNHRQKNDSFNDVETVQSEYTDCCSDTCSSVSSCCSCKTVEPATPENCKNIPKTKGGQNRNPKKEVSIQADIEKPCQKDIDETDSMKANMVEMNTKLITTSELLKDRLRELEDEIETFRKENMNLNKLKEDIEAERHKFYEEKKEFEQKFNEEKILSEYYLAEEKEKLNKQKQTYDRYVREMRGRLNKKEKDEVINLKQEISSLKEEIRIKDAKSTSTIARLRNQLKIMEKEKADLQSEVEKLKKENRRIQHSNDITRRLSNMKYLQEINKKLSNMGKGTQSEVDMSNDVKYKAFEIERQSRSRKAQQNKNTIRPRAKSVPNLNVTSKYAKYFSQRDTASHLDRNTTNIEPFVYTMIGSDDEKENLTPNSDDNDSDMENENNLEKLYMETFRPNSPKSNRSSTQNSNNNLDIKEYKSNNNIEQTGFFLRKSNSSSSRDSQSPGGISKSSFTLENVNRSKSPVSILSKSLRHKSPTQNDVNLSKESELSRSKSPVSMSTNNYSHPATVIHKDLYRDRLSVSPEPSTSKTSFTKTKLTPTEIRKSDGSKELRFPNGNVKYVSADGKYTKFVYYNGDVKENFLNEGRIKYFYAETKTYHTTHADGLEVLEFPDGQVEKRYKDGSSEIRLPNGSIRYHDPKNSHVREEWRFPDGAALTISANGEKRIVFGNGQIEVHAKDHKRREFPDGTIKLVYNDGTSETRYASGRVRIKDKHGNLIMDSAPG